MQLPLLAALFFYLDEIAGTAISSDITPVARRQKAWFLPAALARGRLRRFGRQFHRTLLRRPAGKKRGFCRLRLRVAPAALWQQYSSDIFSASTSNCAGLALSLAGWAFVPIDNSVTAQHGVRKCVSLELKFFSAFYPAGPLDFGL